MHAHLLLLNFVTAKPFLSVLIMDFMKTYLSRVPVHVYILRIKSVKMQLEL